MLPTRAKHRNIRFRNELRCRLKSAVKVCGRQQLAVRITLAEKVLQPPQLCADSLKILTKNRENAGYGIA
jgi:hypothetical protein